MCSKTAPFQIKVNAKSIAFCLPLFVCVCGGGVSFYNKGGGRNLTIDNE